jgi:hypothetical protein
MVRPDSDNVSVYNLVDIPAEHHLNRTSLRTKLSRVSASITLPGSWFQRRIACGEKIMSCTL